MNVWRVLATEAQNGLPPESFRRAARLRPAWAFLSQVGYPLIKDKRSALILSG